jgi:hypothetical protein
MQFGQKKLSLDSKMVLIDHVFKGEIDKTIVQYTSRISVASTEQETAQFLAFSDMLRELKAADVLTSNRDDRTTLPSFTIEYPKQDYGSYFVILNWCEKVVQSELDKVTE